MNFKLLFNYLKRTKSKQTKRERADHIGTVVLILGQALQRAYILFICFCVCVCCVYVFVRAFCFVSFEKLHYHISVEYIRVYCVHECISSCKKKVLGTNVNTTEYTVVV